MAVQPPPAAKGAGAYSPRASAQGLEDENPDLFVKKVAIIRDLTTIDTL